MEQASRVLIKVNISDIYEQKRDRIGKYEKSEEIRKRTLSFFDCIIYNSSADCLGMVQGFI